MTSGTHLRWAFAAALLATPGCFRCVCAPPFCGDDLAEPREDCDGNDVGGLTCASLGFTSGSLACRPDCTLDLGGCTTCGDGVVEAGEDCDGADLGSADCAALGYATGALACAPSCTWNASDCSSCGNGVLEGSEACDDANAVDDDACSNACRLNCRPSFWSRWPENPVMGPGPPGEFDALGVRPGTVLRDEAGSYWMWYDGWDGTAWRIGYAISADGLAWSRLGLALDTGAPGEADSAEASTPAVAFDGTQYVLWYTGLYAIGDLPQVLRASSPDGGAPWTKLGVYAGGMTGPSVNLSEPAAWIEDGISYVWVVRRFDGGQGWNIVMPYFNFDFYWAPGTWEHNRRHPYVARGWGSYWIFYAGTRGGVGQPDRIGIAEIRPFSSSLASSYAVNSNMILDVGPAGAWDEDGVSTPAAILDEDLGHLWYGGFDGTTWQIGYATGTCVSP